MPLTKLKGKKFFVMGLGKTGRAAAKFLVEELGCKVTAWDAKPAACEGLPSSVEVKKPSTIDWSEFDGLIKSPGIPESQEDVFSALAAGVKLWSDIDLAQLRAPEATYIAITGTNGKSTTTALIGHLLKSAGLEVEVGGNIGRPALDMPVLDKNGFYVLELSSYQLLSVNTFHANVAVLINISADHMERHRTMEAYIAAKERIFRNQEPSDLRVVGVDNYELEKLAISLGLGVRLRRVSVTGVGAGVTANNEGVMFDYDFTPPKAIYDLSKQMRLPGKHNWQNVVCAWAAVKDFLTVEQFIAGLESFGGLKHRLQRVLDHKGVTFRNDSKATNADATIRALDSVEDIFLLAGGQAKEEGFVPCLEHLQNVKGIYLLGEAEERFAEELKDADVPVKRCGTLKEATTAAYADAQKYAAETGKNPTVLLSPACASWDQFDSFEHRGNVFIEIAYDLCGMGQPPEEEEE